jgi:AcrR family transcriptional regulator
VIRKAMTDLDIRHRILAAAAALIAQGGRDAATTRAVSAAAAVQAPTIYRLFGDKDGLLAAVAEHVFATYVVDKAQAVDDDPDPVQALRLGWDTHVAFGLAHPDLFRILSTDPRPPTPAMIAGQQVLAGRINAIARGGRLRIPEERALGLLQAAGIGTVLTLLGLPPDQRDPGLSVAMREAVLGTMIGPMVTGGQTAAVTLRAGLDDTGVLSPGETLLLRELLDRIANAGQVSAQPILALGIGMGQPANPGEGAA